LKFIRPCLFDKTTETEFDRHYIYHTAWAIRKIIEIKPTVHYDFSSSLYFIGMTSAICDIIFHDYRPANLQISGLSTFSCDLTNLNYSDESIDSISCMHVIEHIGLGRYGDPLDPYGDLKAAKELKRILKVNGNLLVVLPLGGRPRIRFNANRIYDLQLVLQMFDGLKLLDFTYITDYGNPQHIYQNPSMSLIADEIEGCGCFHFIKIK
jgi:SAM-dependent methyltransferase